MSEQKRTFSANWRNDGGERPPYPDDVVRSVLREFGIPRPDDLRPWPFGASDVLASFTNDGRGCALKGRFVEQRGTKAVHETQNIQLALRRLGLPLADLLPAPNGETLIPGPDWEGLGETYYYEIQEILHGAPPALDENTAYRMGVLTARLHLAGLEVDTHLLNKSLYIKDFIIRGFEREAAFRQRIKDCGLFSSEDISQVTSLLDRNRDLEWRSRVQWSVIHGDLCCENMMADGSELSLIDMDEAGIGPITSDLGDFVFNLEDLELTLFRSFLAGYREHGGFLGEAEKADVVDMLVRTKVSEYLEAGHRAESVAELFGRFESVV